MPLEFDSVRRVLHGPAHILDLLERLHDCSLAEEAAFESTYDAIKALRATDPARAKRETDALMRDKFVALEADKAAFVYTLIRSSGALNVVEAGTSFGVSTVYLALAVGRNAAAKGVGSGGARVVATELEVGKAARAREHWAEAGEEVERWIELREGDLLETLKQGLPRDGVDFVLLDIWSPLALPTLKTIEHALRPGALIVTDNVIASSQGYVDFFEYINASEGKYRNLTVPYGGGLELILYEP